MSHIGKFWIDISFKHPRCIKFIKKRKFTHVDADPPDGEDLYLRVHAGHEPEELLAVLVPLHRVELAAGQRVVAAEVGGPAQDQLPRHAQTLHTQWPAACKYIGWKFCCSTICAFSLQPLIFILFEILRWCALLFALDAACLPQKQTCGLIPRLNNKPK